MSESEDVKELRMFNLNQFPLFLLRGHTALLSVCHTSSYIHLSLPLPWEPISGNRETTRLAQGCSRESLAEPEDRTLLLVQGSDILSCTSSHGAPTGAQHGIAEISKIFSIPPTFVQMSPMEMNTAEDVPV